MREACGVEGVRGYGREDGGRKEGGGRERRRRERREGRRKKGGREERAYLFCFVKGRRGV